MSATNALVYQLDSPHQERSPEMFLLGVLFIPGQAPYLATTSRFVVEDNNTDALSALLNAVLKIGGNTMMTELRKKLGLKETGDAGN